MISPKKQELRNQIEAFFRNEAAKENEKGKQITIEDVFGKNTKKEDRILFNVPESLGDCILTTSLLDDLRVLYPDKKIFVATKRPYFDVFIPLVGSLIDAVIEWSPIFDNELVIEKEVLISYNVTCLSQKFLSYTHNGADKTNIDFSLNKELN